MELSREKKKMHLLVLMAVLFIHLLTTLEITVYCKSITIFFSNGYLINVLWVVHALPNESDVFLSW